LSGLASLIAFVCLPALAAGIDYAGIWQGTLSVGETRLRVVFHVEEAEDGSLDATMDSPDQGAKGIPISRVTVEGEAIRLEVDAINAAYVGRRADTNRIEGHWKQGGLELPLTIERVEEAVEIRRPQEPKAPFPYAEEAVELRVSDAVSLAGTLTLPGGSGPHPAVVLVSGSGPQDRDETLAGHRPFLVLADDLARRGIVVLRFDDRGVGGSSGSTMESTLADRAHDSLAAVRYLRERPEVDPGRVGLIGHSEGGWVLSLSATEAPDEVAFLVMLAGPAQSPRDLLQSQQRALLEANGAGPAMIEAMQAMTAHVFEILASTPDTDEAAERLVRLSEELGPKLSEESRRALDEYLAQQPEAMREATRRTVNTAWFRDLVAFDAEPPLRGVTQPLLALYGGSDLQVPADENRALLEKLLGDDARHTIRVFPKLNHLFQPSETGLPTEYGAIETTIAPPVLEAIGGWIVDTASRSPSAEGRK
jgi:hypothetical protein